MFKRRLSTHADVYTSPNARKKVRLSFGNYKPSQLLKRGSIVALGAIVLLGTAVILTPKQQAQKQLAQDAATIATSDTTADGCRYHDDTTSDNNRNWNCNPLYVPPVQLIAAPTPYPNIPGTPNGNGSAISGQILSIQQQIGNQMQSCISYARQEANQIIGMKNRAQQMQNQIDNLNNQLNNIDTSTPAGQSRHDRLAAYIQQLQTQLDNYNTAINNTQDQFNQTKDRCSQNVDNLKQAREDAEGKLDDAFSNAMNIQFPF